MTALAQSLVTAYETCGLTAEQISEQEDLDLLAVKAVLTQYSNSYRKYLREQNKETTGDKKQLPATSTVPSADILTEEDFNEIKQVYKELACHSENDTVRERACKFLLNEFKGRNNPVQSLKDAPHMNIQTFNILLQRSRQTPDPAPVAPTYNVDAVEV